MIEAQVPISVEGYVQSHKRVKDLGAAEEGSNGARICTEESGSSQPDALVSLPEIVRALEARAIFFNPYFLSGIRYINALSICQATAGLQYGANVESTL